MMRRSVQCDLWANQTAAERPEPPVEITDQWIIDPENRSRILSALWALTRYALTPEADGRTPAQKADIGKPLASFEGWSHLVAGIVVACGFENPLAPSMSITSGDLEEDDVVTLIHEVLRAAKLAPGATAQITCKDLIPLAREKERGDSRRPPPGHRAAALASAAPYPPSAADRKSHDRTCRTCRSERGRRDGGTKYFEIRVATIR